MSDEIAYASASRLLALYRAGTLSPVEATRSILARIARLDPKVNAFCLVDEEAALAAARASEARWRAGAPMGPLDGVPASIKDLILTRGWPTLRGSHTVERDQPWTEDAPATARLRESGAVLLGKTTTPEFGWKGVTDGPLTGITRNPWNLERTAGGSSGGASAQVAAGFGPLAVGTDGGGSIRMPAGFAGIVGLKPSFGRVPAWPASPMSTLAHLGPMTRTVTDAARMLNVLAQPDARDWYALPYDGRDWTAGLEAGVKGLRIAYSATLGYAKVEAEVAAGVAAAAEVFVNDLGAHVEAVDPGFSDPVEIFWTLWIAGAFKGMGGIEAAKKKRMEPPLVACIEAGARLSLKDNLDAIEARVQLGMRMRQFHESYDLLLTPTLAVPAFKVGELAPGIPTGPGAEPKSWTSWTPFTYPFNLSQQPAITVPAGFTRDGLPIGLQIVGPMHREDLVLRAARAFEIARPWDARRPDLG